MPSFIRDYKSREEEFRHEATCLGMFPFLKKLFADGANQGPQLRKVACKSSAASRTLKIVAKRSDGSAACGPAPNAARRALHRMLNSLSDGLAKDWRNSTEHALSQDASPGASIRSPAQKISLQSGLEGISDRGGLTDRRPVRLGPRAPTGRQVVVREYGAELTSRIQRTSFDIATLV